MKKTLLFVAVGLLGFTSCKKEGCTDANAFNYDVTAEKDDESCTYQATGVFYYSQDTYLNKMISPAIPQLEYFIDGASIGVFNSDDGWVAESGTLPDCNSTVHAVVNVSMGAQLQKLHNWEVTNAANGEPIPGFAGNMVFVGGTCHAIELE